MANYTDEEMYARQDALRNVRSIEDWYRMYPQHNRRWSHERPAQTTDHIAQAYERANALLGNQPVAPHLPGKVMTSRYSGRCLDCNGWIAAGETIRYDGKAHHYPECPATPEPEEAPNDVVRHPEDNAPTSTESVPDGRITLEFEDGHYRTFRIRTQPEDASFAPGKRVVQYLSDRDNDLDSSYIGFGFLNADGTVALWKRFKDDSQLAVDASVLGNRERAAELGLKYAMKSGNCCRCGRTLTVPASLHRGMGPECSQKGWL